MRTIILLLGFCVCSVLCYAQPSISGFSPLSAASGMTLTINGTNFTGATAVSFGGTAAASFTVVSATKITAVVAAGSSGAVQVTTPAGNATRSGFIYISTSRIITDFGGFWESTTASPNATIPDSSHMLLAFTFYGTTYSTGVNDAALSSRGAAFTAGNFRALPVAGITGVTASTNTYLALSKKADGSANVANTPAVSGYSIMSVLSDGVKGLDLGTGVTNLPGSAVLTFQISNIDGTKILDSEPDIILTQIAQPVTGNDIYSFIDGSGNVVGASFSQNMTLLPKFGSYDLDLFNLTPNTPYNYATAYSAFATNTNREVRLVAIRLSDFGITPSNVAQVKALRVTPSGNSDYAFVAYNANAINLSPNITQNTTATHTTICTDGTAVMSVLSAAAADGALSYSWEQSTNGGATWTSLANGGNYSGAATNQLAVTNAVNGYQYRATVQETGNANTATSPVFTITVSAPAMPTSVTVSGTGTTCLNNSVQLTSNVAGGSNLNYQWQTNADGAYQDISGATLDTYLPPVNKTGTASYRLRVSTGSGCPGSVLSATPATVTVTGVSSVISAAVCASGSVNLAATATSGTIDWYNADAGGASLFTGDFFTTPLLSSSKIYYVSASGCASALRVPVLATVHRPSAGGAIAGGGTVAAGVNSITLTLSGQTGTVLKWQSSPDDFSASITDIANTTATLTAANLTQTTRYRTLVQSGNCGSVFSPAALVTVTAPLPIHFNSVKASKEAGGIRIQWTAYNQQATDRFEVERSTDGLHFKTIYTTAPANVTDAKVTYQWLDEHPESGSNSYRIKELLYSGTVTLSKAVRIDFKENHSGISIAPNPVQHRNFTVQRMHLAAGRYKLRIMNISGQVVYTKILNHTGGTFKHAVQLPQHVSTGWHGVSLQETNGLKECTSIQLL